LCAGGACLRALGRDELAEQQLAEGIDRLREARGLSGECAVEAIRWLVDLYTETGRPEQAAQYQAMLPGESDVDIVP
jgi:hypothetical protein